MIKLIMTYKNVMPNIIWHFLKDTYWFLFWKDAEKEQKKVLGDKLANKLAGSERASLNEAILNNYPFDTFLEVGCGVAQNFHVLCKIIKEIKLIGVDCNSEIIKEGLQHLKVRGFNNVELLNNLEKDLTIFPDKSFDLVITAACLLFIPANNIEHFAKEIIRVAKKKIILLEQNTESEDDLGKLTANKDGLPDYWLRNYYLLFSKLLGKDSVSIRKVPIPLWTTEEWQRDASIIEIII